MAALQSGGQLLAPLEQETALSWAGFVLLTLEAVGLPLHAKARPPGPLSKDGNSAAESLQPLACATLLILGTERTWLRRSWRALPAVR